MKILQICSYLYPALAYGGPAKVVYDLSLELSKKNKVTVYTTDVWDKELRISEKQKLSPGENFQIKYFPNINNFMAFKFRLFTGFGMVWQFLGERKKYDLVHIHDVFILPQLLIAFLARLLSISYIVTPHGVLDPIRLQKKTLIKKLFWFLAKPVLKNAKLLVAVSDKEKKDLRKLGFKKAITIHNGIPKLDIRPSKRFQKHKNKKLLTLLYVGKIHPQKGLKELIIALSKSNLKYQLLIAGPDDGEISNLKQLIKKLKTKNVYFLGFVDDSEKKELYNLSNLFVYPSYAEGFSISILEAMQAGLPVLITDGCNFKDVFKYETGFVVETINLERNLVKILSSGKIAKSNLKKMGQNAQNLIKKKYSVKIMVQKTAIIFQNVLSFADMSEQAQLESLHRIIFRQSFILAKYVAFIKFYCLKNKQSVKIFYFFNPQYFFFFVCFVLVELFYCQIYKFKVKFL